jgi:hypothetical protein
MLWHYSEIAKTEPEEFAVKQLPEYLFTWIPGDNWMSMWITNDISEKEDSFFKFIRVVDLALPMEMLMAKGINELDVEHVKELIGIFSQELYTAKMRGELPTEYLFNN